MLFRSGLGPGLPPPARRSESRALFVRPGRLGGGDRAQASDSRARRRATEHAQRAGQSRCRLRVPRGAGGRARAALAWGRRLGRGRGGEGRGEGRRRPRGSQGPRLPRAFRLAELTQPQASGDLLSGRLPGLGRVRLNNVIRWGLLLRPPKRQGQFLKGPRGAKD